MNGRDEGRRSLGRRNPPVSTAGAQGVTLGGAWLVDRRSAMIS